MARLTTVEASVLANLLFLAAVKIVGDICSIFLDPIFLFCNLLFFKFVITRFLSNESKLVVEYLEDRCEFEHLFVAGLERVDDLLWPFAECLSL